jgi:hypothetical protein
MWSSRLSTSTNSHIDSTVCRTEMEGGLRLKRFWSDIVYDDEVSAIVGRCHNTLIDFDFARALSPQDMKTDKRLLRVNFASIRSEATWIIDGDSEEDIDAGLASRNKVLCLSQSNTSKQVRGRSRTRAKTKEPLNDISHSISGVQS